MALTSKQWLLILIIPLTIAIVLVGLLVYSLVYIYSDKGPVVKTKVGSIRGLKATDGDYDMYLGISYGDVDKNNVFGASHPHRKFKKVFKAHHDSVICPQYEEFNKTITGTLDCLRLNIYVPHSASVNNLPVLIFIHGGDYKTGYGGRGLYGPKYLMKHDIILVTVNYRLGPYGFLCVDVPGIGNQGLKDQLLALRWVKDNIESFGGNADNVTLAGVGSGGEMVNLHLLYGKEKLFQKVIIDSGIYLNQLNEEDGIESVPIEMSNNMGFKTEDEIEALNFLKTKSTKAVIASSIRLNIEYGPCIEKSVSGVQTFIINQTLNTTAEHLKTIPIIITHSNKELLQVLAYQNLNNSEASDTFKYELVEHFKFKDERLRKAEKNLRQFYIGNAKISNAVKSQIVDFKSDLYHNVPTKRMIVNYLKNGATVYYGVFSYSGWRNFVKRMYNITGHGATKEDVLGYLFDMPYIEKPVVKRDQVMIDRMTALWANFVKYGNPTPVTTELIPVKWEPVAKRKLNYMDISSELTLKVTPFRNRTAFWEQFFKMNGRREVPTKLIEPWMN